MSITKTIKTAALAVVVSAVALTSCNKSPYPGYDANPNGVYSKFYKHAANGIMPKDSDLVRLVMSYKNSKDSVLFDSKGKNNPSGKNYIEFPLMKSTFHGSFEDAVSMMAVGDSASFMISADSVYLKTFKAKELPNYVVKGSMLTFNAKLEKITGKEEVKAEKKKKMAERDKMMADKKAAEATDYAKYLDVNKITTKPTASGLIYIEKTKGKGAHPKKGDNVKVKYTGRLLNGTVFDTSDKDEATKANIFDAKRPYDPIDFPLGVGQVIPGWDEGIMLMSPGAKGQLILPSALGYGEQGGGPIPPFSPLVFDVELVSFTAGKPAAVPPGTPAGK